ncbi:MAG: hypothetical protein K6T99_01650 [Armatimonadetes bacterium]|nr:hypothetical protein [Armatimonadota bacterium]
MLRRTALVVIAAALMAVVFSPHLTAQTTPVPEASVKGTGAILVDQTTYGVFDINVARSGNVLFGGFKYQELPSNPSIRPCVIYSRSVTGLRIEGNHAWIHAVGWWNGMAANLMVEVIDDLNQDWFHIVAKPLNSPLPIIYDKAGGVIKGDIVVYSAPPTPNLSAKGQGTIAVGKNTGKFTFEASKINGVVKGSLYYVEYNPLVQAVSIRPPVKIYLPAVEHLQISENVAVMVGKGTFNGRPALIEVKAIDNAAPDDPSTSLRDEFYIRAIPLVSDSLSKIAYSAGGPLTSGDIAVIVYRTP